MSFFRRAQHSIGSAIQLAPEKPAIAAGLRAGVAIIVPLLAGSILHDPHAVWAALGGFLTAVADKGGAYRVRASTTLWLAILGSISAIVAAFAGHSVWIAVPLMFLWATGTSVIRVFGAGATSVGISSAIIFADSLATPTLSVSEALTRGGYVFAGATWAIVLSLVLWPIRYYRPLRIALAGVYDTLANHADALAQFAISKDPRAEREIVFQHGPGIVRDALDGARRILVSTRRGRSGESPRGTRLLLMLQGADQSFAILIAIGEILDAAQDARGSAPHRQLQLTLQAYAATAREIADSIVVESGPIAPPDITWGGAALQATLTRHRGESASLTEQESVQPPITETQHEWYASAVGLLARLRDYTETVTSNLATLNSGAPVSQEARSLVDQTELSSQSPREILRDALTPSSIAFRHALRVGIMTAAAVLITTLLELPRGYWVTLTVIVTLQPYTAATVLKGVQRVGGTVLGGIAAALITDAFRSPDLLLVTIFMLGVVGVALMPINYGLYSAFLACEFILLSEMSGGDYHLFQVRILNTLLGGGLALTGALLIWPSSERTLFPSMMANAMRAARTYILDISARLSRAESASPPHAHAHPDAHADAHADARRDVGLSLLNAEALLQRVLIESPYPRPREEAAMTLLLFTRRVVAAMTGVSALSWNTVPERWRDTLRQVGDFSDDVLSDLADAIEQDRVPRAFPNFTALLSAFDVEDGSGAEGRPSGLVCRAQVERVVRQLRVLHTAATRWATSPSNVNPLMTAETPISGMPLSP